MLLSLKALGFFPDCVVDRAARCHLLMFRAANLVMGSSRRTPCSACPLQCQNPALLGRSSTHNQTWMPSNVLLRTNPPKSASWHWPKPDSGSTAFDSPTKPHTLSGISDQSGSNYQEEQMIPNSSNHIRKDISRAEQDLLLQPLISLSPCSAMYRQDRPELHQPSESEPQEHNDVLSRAQSKQENGKQRRRKA